MLQYAFGDISDLRIVENLDKSQSTTQGHGKSTNIKYETSYDHLINACVRYHKTHKANLDKKSTIYATLTQNVENTPDDEPSSSENPWESSFQCNDIPTNKFDNVNSTSLSLQRTSRHHNTPRLPPKTSNHSMTPMVNPHQKHQEITMGWTYLSTLIHLCTNE